MYDPDDLWPLNGSIEGAANAWLYLNNEDSIGTITSPGFIATGGEAGMQVGDLVWVVNQVSPAFYQCQCTVVAHGGALNLPTSATIAQTTPVGISFSQVFVTSGATSGSPYIVPGGVQRILVNKTIGAPTYIRVPLAATMGSVALGIGVLVVDFKGDALTNNITIEFTGGELCNGDATVVISNNGGWAVVNPSPGGGSWYRS